MGIGGGVGNLGPAVIRLALFEPLLLLGIRDDPRKEVESARHLFRIDGIVATQDVFVQMILRPHRMVSLRTDGHWLRATSSRDLVYAGGGATSQHNFGYGGTPTGGRNELAYVVDVGATVTPTDMLTLSMYYAHAFGQGIIRQAYIGQDADYAYVEATISF